MKIGAARENRRFSRLEESGPHLKWKIKFSVPQRKASAEFFAREEEAEKNDLMELSYMKNI